jgi:NADH-quinone oxidoreductase subunit E
MSKLPAPSVKLSPERMARFQEYAAEYPNLRSALMMVLRLAEEEFGSITDEAMHLVADLCQVNVAHVQGMVTFYTHFKRPFHGKHRFMVCATLMCALEGNTAQAEKQIKEKLGIAPGERTGDGLFSCEKVECLADCDRPPVVQCDAEHFCSMKGKLLDDYLDKLMKAEGKSSADYKGKAGVKMDQRVSYLPNRYAFAGETDVGAKHFDDKDPFSKGAAPAVTQVPRPLHTPLSAPVGDGVSGITSREGRDSIPHSGNRVEAGHGAHGNGHGNGHQPSHKNGGKDKGAKHG